MFYLLTSLTVASIFGMVVSGVYGTKELINHPWTDLITWSIISAGVFMADKGPLHCWYSRLMSKYQEQKNDHGGCISW